jgi:hypothetical protein
MPGLQQTTNENFDEVIKTWKDNEADEKIRYQIVSK